MSASIERAASMHLHECFKLYKEDEIATPFCVYLSNLRLLSKA